MKQLVRVLAIALLISLMIGSLTACDLDIKKPKTWFKFLYDCKTCCDKGEIECDGCDGEKEVTCFMCHGTGRKDCIECNGTGYTRCFSCHGLGYQIGGGTLGGSRDCFMCIGGRKICPTTSPCYYCLYDGKVNCSKCSATGVIDCPDCDK